MAAKKQIKKDFISKEAMYRKIMPSITSPVEYTPEDEAIRDEAGGVPEYTPYNVMELIIRAKLHKTMDTLGACTCEQCRNDCIALALNSLPTVYTVSSAERIQEKASLIRAKNEIKITAAVIRAVQTVMAEPRH